MRINYETIRPLQDKFPIPDLVHLEFIAARIAFAGFNQHSPLLAQAKPIHNLAVPIRVPAVQIIQQSPALVDHHDQSPP
jgi:hypothetical protein